LSTKTAAARQILAALSLLVLSACATTSTPTAPPPGVQVAEAPDYTKINATWTFHVVHKTHSGSYRSDMENGDFEIRIQNGNYQRFRVEGGKRVRVSGETWLYSALPLPDIIKAETRYYSFPLWVGKTWQGRRLMGTRWRDTHHTVTGIESVTTPAGAFEAYRIERSILLFVGTDNYYETYVYYYSPQTRSIVKFEHKEESKDLVGDPKYSLEETVSYELLSYKED
jgi:hypothetical protein